MSAGAKGGGSGCALLFGVILAIGLAVAALISLAALIDPFSWLPSVAEVWADCDDDYSTDRNECALANRFPGFWEHALANLAWTTVTAVVLIGAAATVGDLRERRAKRFADAAAAERYAETRETLVGAAALAAVLAALPIVVALV